MKKYIYPLALIIALGVVALATACGESPTPPPDIMEAQAVTPATPTPAPLPTATVKLITEIIEPDSPVSPPPQPPQQAELMPNINPNNLPPGSEAAVKAAIADLAKQKNLPVTDISVVSVEAVEWNDSSLGCPQEGFMYAQVITPGYLIKLTAGGRQYQYHTDQTKTVVLCQK